MTIYLKEINKDNWQECIKLSVGDKQKKFIVSNMYSLVESRYEIDMIPLAIYNEEKMIGFAMYGRDPEDYTYWIIRFMIDKKYQNYGYGKLAMGNLIRLISSNVNCNNIYIDYNENNMVAKALYESFGFQEINKVGDGDVIAKLNLNK